MKIPINKVRISVNIRKDTFDKMLLLLKLGGPFTSINEIANHAFSQFLEENFDEYYKRNIGESQRNETLKKLGEIESIYYQKQQK
jgi:chromosome condensin MukBEF MukE localization factor